MQTESTDVAPPWYRQPWPWFLISLPAAAIIGCIVTTVLAVRSADGVVADYYQRGLSINNELARTRRARGLEANAALPIDETRPTRPEGQRSSEPSPARTESTTVR